MRPFFVTVILLGVAPAPVIAQGQTLVPPPQVVEGPPEQGGFVLESLYTQGGLTADEAARRAVEVAPSMNRARASVELAEAGSRRAFLGVLPRLALTARYTRLSDVENSGFTQGFTPEQEALARQAITAVADPVARGIFLAQLDSQIALANFTFPVLVNQYALQASLSYPVSDLFFSILPAYSATEEASEASRLQLDAQRQTIDLQAREAFYNYARARGGLIVAQSSVAQAEAQHRQVSALVAAGAAARVDLMRIEALLASARVAVAQAEGGVRVAGVALRMLMHSEGNELPLVGEQLEHAPPPIVGSEDELVVRAVGQRVELRALRTLVTSRQEAIRARAGARYPHLGAQFNVDVANPNNRIFPQQEEFRATWDVSAVLTWSPNDLLTANADVSQAEAELAQTQSDLDQLEDAVRLEVAQARASYDAARAAFEAAATGIAAAEESYRVRLEQLRAGAAVLSDLTDADTEVTRSRLQLLNAAIDLRIAEARLRRASGG